MSKQSKRQHLEIIGSNIHVDVMGRKNVPAKIDTGADSSAFWVSDVTVKKDGILYFKLFGEGSQFYNGKVMKRTNYKVVVTRSSHGDEKLFYRTHIPIRINDRRINVLCTLSDRSNNNFPILIGKRTIKGKFLVDVSRQEIVPPKKSKTKHLNQKMQKDAVKFYKEYFSNDKQVKNYYYDHFPELSKEKQFHFATRMKVWKKTKSFDQYLKNNIPETNIKKLLSDNNYENVNFLELRRPYFEEYQNLYALEATLVRINHLLNIYALDLREEFKKEFPLEKLYSLVDHLIEDEEALKVLSTYAINIVALTETLFPREKESLRFVAEKSLSFSGEPGPILYLLTHIIICSTDFYYHPARNFETMTHVFVRAEEILKQNYDQLPLDMKLEFLVCAKILGKKTALKQKIKAECNKILEKSPFLIDEKKPARLNTLNGAEHRNILYIMSGLDG